MQHSDASDGAPGVRLSPPAWLAAAALLVFTLSVRAIGWGPSVIDLDESIFSLAAREVVAGHLPYLTMFDIKPVGSTLILAGAFATFGQSILVARLVGAAFVWAAGMLVAALVRSDGFSRTEALVAGLVQIAFMSAVGIAGQATMIELMLTPFTVLAALLVYRLIGSDRHRQVPLALAAGLSCGIAILLKITPVLPGVTIAATLLLLAVLRGRMTLVRAALLLVLFGAAAIVPMLAAAGVYAANGALDAFWWSNFGFAGAYSNINPSLATVALRVGSAVDVLWPLFLLALVAVLDAATTWRRGGQQGARIDGLAIVALFWLAAEMVTVSATRHFYSQYFLTLVAPLVILTAFGLRAIARWIGAVDRSRVALVLGALLALITVERTQVDMARDRVATPDAPRRIAGAIRKASKGHVPTLFVTDDKLSATYLLTGSPLPPTRFAMPAHLFSPQSRMIRADPQVEVARVLASRPEFIVFDDAKPLPGWAQAQFAGIAGDYRPFYTLGTVRVLERSRG